MAKLLAILPLLALPLLACTSTAGDGTLNSCTPVTPDGGTAPEGAVCDVAWSCANDTQHFEMACTFENGSFLCTCYTEGVAAASFPVNVFSCDNTNAIPAATTGCQWMISQ
jgi:hypothetical protein